jgi:uncharacterized membrane protein
MKSAWWWALERQLQKLWVVQILYAALAVATVLGTPLITPFLSPGLLGRIDDGAVDATLTILASSMLSVTTFSLGIMLTAFSGASSSVTPRATDLLQQDRTTQRVLSTFLGAFIFSFLALIALRAGFFGENDKGLLFLVTLVVAALVVVSMLRWIAHLTRFGRRGDTHEKLEAATLAALAERVEQPYLGGHPHNGPPPADGVAIAPASIGYVAHVDMGALQAAAAAAGADGAQVYLAALPGAFAHPGAPLCWCVGEADPDRLRAAFTIAPTRTFDQDPRFGLSVLSEVAERALSPAINDPGTAIDILGRMVRVLAVWQDRKGGELRYPALWVPPLDLSDMLEDAFAPIARDGAGIVAVQLRLQKSLLALVQIDAALFGPAALRQSQQALERSAGALLPFEQDRVRGVAEAIATLTGPSRGQPGI